MQEVFYYEISRRKLGLGKLSFVLSVVCELFGKFYSWARRTKVRSSLTGCAEIPPTYFVLTAVFASAVLT